MDQVSPGGVRGRWPKGVSQVPFQVYQSPEILAQEQRRAMREDRPPRPNEEIESAEAYRRIIAEGLKFIPYAPIVFISANSGVVSASRLTYSMSLFKLVPRWFNRVNKRFATPMRTIVVFSGVAIVQTLVAFFTPGGSGAPFSAIHAAVRASARFTVSDFGASDR